VKVNARGYPVCKGPSFDIREPDGGKGMSRARCSSSTGGEKGGKATLLIHTVSKIPVIAGGSGSLIGFNFKLGRTYEY
jgi:hypothetical protein